MTLATELKSNAAQALEQMGYCLYIVGSHDGAGAGNGMMADWVMQVSFVPRMVAVSFENDAHTLANIRETGSFTVNLLPQDDSGRTLASRFGQPRNGSKVAGRSNRENGHIHNKLDGVAWRPSDLGSPVLDGAISWFECTAEEFLPLGDHTMVAGRVVGGDVRQKAEVLTSSYAGWTYSG